MTDYFAVLHAISHPAPPPKIPEAPVPRANRSAGRLSYLALIVTTFLFVLGVIFTWSR